MSELRVGDPGRGGGGFPKGRGGAGSPRPGHRSGSWQEFGSV